jgi:methylmalonyl-CoA mutase cobalamin-binding subunit
MIEMMKERDITVPIIVGGSVITKDDANKLKAMGAADAFCPSASDHEIIQSIRRIAGEGSESND